MNLRKLLFALALLLLVLAGGAYLVAVESFRAKYPRIDANDAPAAVAADVVADDPPAAADPATPPPTPEPRRTRGKRWEATGVVLAFDDDAPVAGARIAVHRAAATGKWDLKRALDVAAVETETTDAAGRFTVRCPAGAALLVATADGFSPAAVVAQRGGDELELSLQSGEPYTFVVVDIEDHVVADAEVLVYADRSDDAPAALHTTDEDGRVDLVLGEYQALRVAARGLSPRTIGVPLELADRRIVLRPEPPSRAVSGTVVDRESLPIAGATVGTGSADTRTDAQGRFRLPDVTIHTEALQVGADGFAARRVRLSRDLVEESYRITLDRSVEVGGDVLLADESPAAGAKVRIGDVEVETDARGRFRAGGIEPGAPIRAYAFFTDEEGREHEGWASVTRVSTRGVTGLRIVVRQAGSSFLALRLQFADGKPAGGLLVRADGASARSDDDGRVVLGSGRPAGSSVAFHVAAQNRPGGPLSYGGHAETTSRRDALGEIVRLPAPIPVRVTLLDPDGAPLPAEANPSVQVYGGAGSRVVDDRGVEVGRRPGTPLVLLVHAEGYPYMRITPWSPPDGGGEVNVRMRPASVIRGRLVDAAGHGIEADLHAWAEDGATSQHASARSGDDGVFVFDPAPVGVVRIGTTRGPNDTIQREVRVTAGQAADVGALVERTPATVSGRVLDGGSPGGRPVRRAHVEYATSREDLSFLSRWTGEEGTFSLRVPTRDDGWLVITAPELGAALVRVGPEGGDLGDIALGREARIRVRRPRLSASSIVVGPAATGVRWHPDARPEGPTMLLLGLPAGRLEVRVNSGGRSISEEVDVAPGKTLEVDMEGR